MIARLCTVVHEATQQTPRLDLDLLMEAPDGSARAQHLMQLLPEPPEGVSVALHGERICPSAHLAAKDETGAV